MTKVLGAHETWSWDPEIMLNMLDVLVLLRSRVRRLSDAIMMHALRDGDPDLGPVLDVGLGGRGRL